jgi:hypothetical protein
MSAELRKTTNYLGIIFLLRELNNFSLNKKALEITGLVKKNLCFFYEKKKQMFRSEAPTGPDTVLSKSCCS